MSRTNLPQTGFAHLLIPLVVVVGVALVGSYLLMNSLAATPSGVQLASAVNKNASCLDDYEQGDNVPGPNTVDLFTCNKTKAQSWTLSEATNTTTGGVITNANGLCLDVANGSRANYAAVDLYKCNGQGNQKWYVSGTKLVNPTSNKCLDDYHSLTANKNKIDIFTCNGTNAQKWTASAIATATSTPPTTTTTKPTAALTAAPASVTSGSASTLTWNSQNATSCTASGAWSGTKATSGSISTGALTATKTYTLTCTGSNGTSTPISTTVTVTAAASGGGTTTALSGCSVSGVLAPCTNSSATGTGASGYGAPVFDDEFNSTSLNTSNWIPGRRNGSGGECTNACSGYNASAEAELFSSSEVSESGGSLILSAINKSLNGGANPWTTGNVEMQNGKNFIHGYFEARIKVPDPTVAWTGYWLSSAKTWPPEIDIFEFSQCGDQPTFNNHGNTPNSNVNAAGWPCGQAYGTSSTDFTQWHTYGLLWTANTLQVYFDGTLQKLTTFSSSDAIPTTAMYPILSYTIHSGTNVPNNSQMDIDYMRIWCPGGGTSCVSGS